MSKVACEHLYEQAWEESSILEHLPMVKRMAYRLSVRMPKRLETQDLISAGIIGLLQAMRDYDATRKNSFQTYAYIRIRGAMLDAMREQDWVPRSFRDRYKRYVYIIQELVKKLGRPPDDEEIRNSLGLDQDMYNDFLEKARPLSFLSLEDLPLSKKIMDEMIKGGPGSPHTDPSESVELKEICKILSDVIDELPEREQRVIQLYYYEELNLKEIGKVLGVGESRVCQIHTQALMRLKGKLHEQGYEK